MTRPMRKCVAPGRVRVVAPHSLSAQAAETLWEMAREAKPALAALRRRVRRDDSDRVRRACERAIWAIEGK